MMSAGAWAKVQPQLRAMSEAMPDQMRIAGLGTKNILLPDSAGQEFHTTRWSGVIEHDVSDQVVVVWAGTPLDELQAELSQHGQCLPLPQTGHRLVDGMPGTVGGLLAMNLPHGLSAQCGPPKDWCLGLCLIRSNGEICRTGSKAVKSVAGYDIHRFACGARGAFFLIAAAALRVHPLRALPITQANAYREWARESVWIQRVLRSDFDFARESALSLIASDAGSQTLWHGELPSRFDHDWMIGPGGLICPNPAPPKLLAGARDMLDPELRFNPHLNYEHPHA